jgi:alanyl-tRNA synthetase
MDEVPQRTELMQDELTAARKQISTLKTDLALSTFNVQLEHIETISSVSVMALELPGTDKDTLGRLADKFREKFPENGICVIGTVTEEGQVIVMAAVTQDLIKRGIKAGELVGHVSRQLGAGGGGAPHLAFGGGRDGSKLPEALGSVRAWVEGKIK